VDYCAVLLSATDSSGTTQYGTSAISPYSNSVHQLLPGGIWYGPWFDIVTEEFWMATGTSQQLSLGIFDPKFGNWEPKLTLRIRIRNNTPILSGQILDRVLYLTLLNDYHVYRIDLELRIFLGNFTAPNDTMLVGNPVTNELYGYSPSPYGIYRFFGASGQNRTTVASISLTGTLPVPSSTINPIDNTMWISLWGSSKSDTWLHVDLKKTTQNIAWAPTGNLDGLFDFNPYTITSQET